MDVMIMRVLKIIPFLSLVLFALFFFLSTRNAELARLALGEAGAQSNELAYSLALKANGDLQVALVALVIAIVSLTFFRFKGSKRR